jgi:hypothetical protein
MSRNQVIYMPNSWDVMGRVLNWREQETLYDDSRHFILTFKSKLRERDINDIRVALWDTFETHCHHSYDCCGHWYRSVYTSTLRRVKRDEWIVEVTMYQNV